MREPFNDDGASDGGTGDAGPIALHVPGGARSTADEWALVLASQGISVRIERGPEGFVLRVSPADLPAAETAVATYLAENPSTPDASHGEPEAIGDPSWAGVGVAIVILAIHFAIGDRQDNHLLFQRGSGYASLIVDGQWWRCITALYLHSGLGHVAANAASGLYFMGAVCRVLGTGVGLFLILMSGGLGNALNAISHSRLHDSVGASTAVFGAIGLLSGIAVARRWKAGIGLRRVWLPVGAGLGLVAMLGTGGPRVDLWAHLYGLLAGCVLGFTTALRLSDPPSARNQWLFGSASVLVSLLCFGLALRS